MLIYSDFHCSVVNMRITLMVRTATHINGSELIVANQIVGKFNWTGFLPRDRTLRSDDVWSDVIALHSIR